MKNPLQCIVDLAQLEGEIAVGAGASDATAIEQKLGVTSKLWCAVSSWIVIEVEGAPDAVHVPPMQPLVLYGQTVVAGEDDLAKIGASVFSTYATGYDQRAIFETPSRVYILVGTGRRVSADLKSVQAAQYFFDRNHYA